MPDISMCTNSNCEDREECYRYRAVPSEHWQSFGTYGHTRKDDGTCKDKITKRVGDKVCSLADADERNGIAEDKLKQVSE
jgi:hypothetical protein